MSEKNEHKRYLTTSQAARILSVSPDTVLKWVKAGKVKSYRTLGGHFRIPLDALGISPQDNIPDLENPASNIPAHLYCWEYLAGGGEIKSECHDCITYRSRAMRCYELRDMPGEFGCARMLCQAECNLCDYYKLVNGQGLNIMILSRSTSLIKDSKNISREKDLHFEFVDSEYQAALTIQSFRPDYIIIDCSFGKKKASNICSHLFDDPRIPVARIILASKSQNLSDYCEKEVFGWIRKPFSLDQLKECIRGVPIDSKIS